MPRLILLLTCGAGYLYVGNSPQAKMGVAGALLSIVGGGTLRPVFTLTRISAHILMTRPFHSFLKPPSPFPCTEIIKAPLPHSKCMDACKLSE
jgi:hypothetical protein